MNLDTTQVPSDLAEGVYAVRATIEGIEHDAVMHYGPRPVFRDSLSCEVHFLNQTIDTPPDSVMVRPIEKLRDVMHFANPNDLKMQIALDIAQAQKILER